MKKYKVEVIMRNGCQHNIIDTDDIQVACSERDRFLDCDVTSESSFIAIDPNLIATSYLRVEDIIEINIIDMEERLVSINNGIKRYESMRDKK